MVLKNGSEFMKQLKPKLLNNYCYAFSQLTVQKSSRDAAQHDANVGILSILYDSVFTSSIKLRKSVILLTVVQNHEWF